MKKRICTLSVTVLFLLASALSLPAASPAVGEKAPDFTLSTPSGKNIRLSGLVSMGPVVLVVLRGYPGYQCPYCNLQVQDFIRNSASFAGLGARVLMVYPGPPLDLSDRANEFLAGKKLPDNFDLVLDPGYDFAQLYGLRWNAAGETAYPSVFPIDRRGVIFFSRIVMEHAGRATAAEILDVMPKAAK